MADQLGRSVILSWHGFMAPPITCAACPVFAQVNVGVTGGTVRAGLVGGGVVPQNGGGRGWKVDEATGEYTMPPKWRALMEWLLEGPDRDPAFQYEWAAANGLHEDSVRRMKRDVRFVREWNRRCAELNIHPERTQSVIDSLHAAAVGGNVQAANLYLQYTDRFTPRQRLIQEEPVASDLSDLELADQLEAQVRHLRVVGDD